MTEPITGPDLLALRATIFRVQNGTPIRGDKPYILRQAPALLAEVERLRAEGAGNPTASSLIAIAEQKARDWQARAEQAEAEHNEFLEDLLKFVPEAYEDDAAAEGIIATWVEGQAKGNERTLRAMHQELVVRQDLMKEVEARAEAGRNGNDPADVLDGIVQDIRRTRLDIEVFTPKPALDLGDVESRVLQAFGDADENGTALDDLTPAQLTELVMASIRREEATT